MPQANLAYHNSCPVAQIATAAAAVIYDLDHKPLAENIRLLELESEAANLQTLSSEGAIFQLGIIAALVDSFVSQIPTTSPALAGEERNLMAVTAMLESVARFIESIDARRDIVRDYYFAPRRTLS